MAAIFAEPYRQGQHASKMRPEPRVSFAVERVPRHLLVRGAGLATVVVGRATRLRHRGLLVYGAWLVDCAAMIVLGLPIPLAVAGGATALAGAFPVEDHSCVLPTLR